MVKRRIQNYNVCFVASNIPFKAPTAGFSHTINVCKNLQKENDEVTVIFNSDIERTFRFGKLRVITVRGWEHEGGFSIKSLLRTPISILKLILICSRYNIQIIHERSGLPRGIGILAAKFLGIKSVTELNDPYLEELDVKHVFLLRMYRIFMLLLTNKVLTQTPLLKAMISKDVHKEKIKIIPNGADVTAFDSKIDGMPVRNKYNIDKDDIVIIFIGAFQPWHGVDKIPFFAEKLNEEFTNVKFLVIGDGPFYKDIENEIKNKNLEKLIILTGSVPHDEIPSYLAAADIAIAPFNTDTYPVLKKHGFWWCPVKLFEYLAMEKPVITTDQGMNKLIVPDRVAGLLAPPQNFNQFLEHLKTMIKNPELRREYGKNGRKIIIEKYTWRVIGKQIHLMYKTL
ncbi:MAG: glycosyltransferase family 4 protein [Candidatus Sigynarchaeota archaeon]